MVKITKKADYGLTFLVALTEEPDKFHSLSAIAKEFDLPYKFIGQVAAELLQAGIVISKEGAAGGYKLAQKPQQISIKSILETLDGPTVKIDCLCGKPCSRQDTCNHRQVVSLLAEAVNESLAGKSLFDISNAK